MRTHLKVSVGHNVNHAYLFTNVFLLILPCLDTANIGAVEPVWNSSLKFELTIQHLN